MANNKDIPYLTSPDKSFIASPLSDQEIAAQKIAKAYRQHERKTFDDVTFDSMQKATPELSIAEADKTRADLSGYKADKSTADVHKALMAAGMTPAYGNVADLADATLYALEGEFGEAGLSLAAIAPMAGQMVTAKRALKAAKESGEEMVTLYRGVDKWFPGKMIKEGKFVGGKSFMIRGDRALDQRTIFVSESKDFARRFAGNKAFHEFDKSGIILEFSVPKSYFKKYGDQLIHKSKEYEKLYRTKRYFFEEGIPKEFLKKVHK